MAPGNRRKLVLWGLLALLVLTILYATVFATRATPPPRERSYCYFGQHRVRKDYVAVFLMSASAAFLWLGYHVLKGRFNSARVPAAPAVAGGRLWLSVAALAALYGVWVFPLALRCSTVESRQLIVYHHGDECFTWEALDAMLREQTLDFKGRGFGTLCAYGSGHYTLTLLPLLPLRPLLGEPGNAAFVMARVLASLAGLATLLVVFAFAARRFGLLAGWVAALVAGTDLHFIHYTTLANTPDLLCSLFLILAVLQVGKGMEAQAGQHFFLAAALSGMAFAVKFYGPATLLFGLCWAASCFWMQPEGARRSFLRRTGTVVGLTVLQLLAFVAGIALLAPYQLSMELVQSTLPFLFKNYAAKQLPNYYSSDLLVCWKHLAEHGALNQALIALGLVSSGLIVAWRVLRWARLRQFRAWCDGGVVVACWILAWSFFVTFGVNAYQSARFLLPIFPLMILPFLNLLHAAAVRLSAVPRLAILGSVVLGLATLAVLPMRPVAGWQGQSDDEMFYYIHGRTRLDFLRLHETNKAREQLCDYRFRVLTDWLDERGFGPAVAILSDSRIVSVPGRYTFFSWGNTNPNWEFVGDYLPDIMLSDEGMRTYYRSLTKEEAAPSQQVREAREYNMLLEQDRLMPYVRRLTIGFPPSMQRLMRQERTSHLIGVDVFVAPWAGLKNLLSRENVEVLDTSLSGAEAIFCRGAAHPGELAWADNPGRQYLEFSLRQGEAERVDYVVLNWCVPTCRACQFSLYARVGESWEKLANQDDVLPSGLRAAGIDVIPLHRLVPAATFRLEIEGYDGSSFAMKDLRFYQGPTAAVTLPTSHTPFRH
jgi:hypothetical protein